MEKQSLVAKAIGIQIRLMTGAVCAGLWQQNVYAGLFAYIFLLTIDHEE